MGQSKSALACIFAACILASVAIADEPAAQDPFGAPASGAPASSAAPENAQSASSTDIERQAEQRIAHVLDQPLTGPLDFIDAPLHDVIRLISEEYDIPILFDTRALEAVAVSPDTEISINISNVTLRTAIELMLRQVEDMTYIFDREVLIVTSEDDAAGRLLTRVYRIDDLLPHGALSPTAVVESPASAPYSSIVDVITRCVEQDSWAMNNTGEGEICVIEPGVMVITQTHRVHEEVERLLATVRRVKGAIEGNAVAANGGNPFE